MIKYSNKLLYWSTGSKGEKTVKLMNNLVAGKQLGPKISNCYKFGESENLFS